MAGARPDCIDPFAGFIRPAVPSTAATPATATPLAWWLFVVWPVALCPFSAVEVGHSIVAVVQIPCRPLEVSAGSGPGAPLRVIFRPGPSATFSRWLVVTRTATGPRLGGPSCRPNITFPEGTAFFKTTGLIAPQVIVLLLVAEVPPVGGLGLSRTVIVAAATTASAPTPPPPSAAFSLTAGLFLAPRFANRAVFRGLG